MDGIIAYALAKNYADSVGDRVSREGFHVQVESDRSILESTGEEKVFYFIPKTSGNATDGYDEYIYANNAWEQVGVTDVDLSGVAQASQLEEQALVLEAIGDKLDLQDTTLSGIDGKIDAQDTAISGIDSKIDAQDLVLSGIDSKIDGLSPSGGTGGLSKVVAGVLDFAYDEIVITNGGIDSTDRIITT
jgi:hypothetical protein